MYFSAENLHSLEVCPVVMNCYNKNRPARDSLVWPDHFFHYYICGGRKMEKHSLDMRGYMQGQPWRKACSVCELAKALVNRDRSMKIVIFSTRDLQEQCHKSYVANYRVNKKSVGDLADVFSQTTSMKVIRKSFLP